MAVSNRKSAQTLFEAERIKTEKRYKRMLDALMKKIREGLKGAKSLGDIKRVLSDIASSTSFDNFCRESARKIVTLLARGQAHSWRAAASASSQGRDIYKALMKELNGTPRGAYIDAVVNENAKLIKTVPQDLAQKFAHMAKKSEYEGLRPEELTQELLKEAPYLTQTEARRIARTESSKAATALVEARARSLGLEFYRWSCVNDLRSRDSHRIMDNVICRWDDPPNPEKANDEKRDYGSYHAGCIFNCRCSPLPVVDDRDLKFPLKVWYNGGIRRVNNVRDFKRLFGLIDERADK